MVCGLYINIVITSGIDGCYDTSIVGPVSSSAFLEFRGTNVFLNDGRNLPTDYGIIMWKNATPMWNAVGGTSWILSKSGSTLICIDAEDPSNRFLLKRIVLAPQRLMVRRVVGMISDEIEAVFGNE